VQATASLARLADSAGESSSPSTDSDSSSDEDSEYEIEDIYQVSLLLFSSTRRVGRVLSFFSRTPPPSHPQSCVYRPSLVPVEGTHSLA
jgi:hypothetical protein